MPVVPCAPVQPVFGIVNYDATEFLTSYPEFTGINPASLANDFVGATFLLNNTCCSRVQDANQRLYLLYLLTAHIATIFQGTNDAGVVNAALAAVGTVSALTLTLSSITSGALAVGQVLTGPNIVPGTAIETVQNPMQAILTESYSAGTSFPAILVPGIPNVSPPLGVVGRISDASEGDVSVSAQWEAPPNANQAYFTQTKYGAQYWTMTARYRTALFVPAPPSAYDPLFGRSGLWGPGNGYGQ